MEVHKSRFITLFIILMLLSSFNFVNAEPGDSYSDPISIEEGVTNGTLPGSGIDNSIWYSINLSGNYQFSLEGPNDTDFDMEVYNSSLILVGDALWDEYPDTMVLYSAYGEFFIKVYPCDYDGVSIYGDFSLNITSFPLTAGDSSSNPIVIDQVIGNETITGNLPLDDYYGDIWYQLNLSGNYFFNLTGDEGTNFDLYLVTTDLLPVSSHRSSYYPIEMLVSNLDDLYLVMISHRTGSGDFSLDITSIPIIPGDSYSNPIIIDHQIENETINGELPINDFFDDAWYSLNLSGDYEFTLNADDDYTDFDLYLYTSNLVSVSSDLSPDYPSVMHVNDLEGMYLLKIVRYSGSGDFNLTIRNNINIPGFSAYSAIEIFPGITTGDLPGPSLDESIWYKIDLFGENMISMTGEYGTDFDMYLYDADLDEIGRAFTSSYPEIIHGHNLDGTYFIEIYPYNQYMGSFTLEIGPATTGYNTESSSDNGYTYTTEVSQDGEGIDAIIWSIAIIGIITLYIRAQVKKTKTTKASKIVKEKVKIKTPLCVVCGTMNSIDALYCEECGTRIK